ncbi:hypothetical protein NPIL_620261 [Nephila pilipes]|uniref:Spider venom protein n=1 Tax=Nephila pilipes TaxID=299642 RepID=A0A8X6MPV7_NEPPI|nr:hypothetical protein NPIL_620261 [Nephila pilipes]
MHFALLVFFLNCCQHFQDLDYEAISRSFQPYYEATSGSSFDILSSNKLSTFMLLKSDERFSKSDITSSVVKQRLLSISEMR